MEDQIQRRLADAAANPADTNGRNRWFHREWMLADYETSDGNIVWVHRPHMRGRRGRGYRKRDWKWKPRENLSNVWAKDKQKKNDLVAHSVKMWENRHSPTFEDTKTMFTKMGIGKIALLLYESMTVNFEYFFVMIGAIEKEWIWADTSINEYNYYLKDIKFEESRW